MKQRGNSFINGRGTEGVQQETLNPETEDLF